MNTSPKYGGDPYPSGTHPNPVELRIAWNNAVGPSGLFGGGGGGGAYYPVTGPNYAPGGPGGGGDGASSGSPGPGPGICYPGLDYTGGGGGAATSSSGPTPGMPAGRGICIIKYTDRDDYHPQPQGHDATGGTTVDYTDPSSGYGYRSHTFIASGSFVINSLSPAYPADIDYLLVAGGGGGGGPGYQGGGGGAGGFVEKTTQPVSAATYPVGIGAGGAQKTVGQDSVFNSVTALGGGKGGLYSTEPGGAGGSGGGAGCAPTGLTAGAATNYPGPTAQGYPGGAAAPYVTPFRGGGGGGSSAVGAVGGAGAGTGGAGSPNVYRSGPGTPVTYAGGGGGGGGFAPGGPGGPTHGAGGAGGGGHGGNYAPEAGGMPYTSGDGQAATANTGGGGGGAAAPGDDGGAGGSGILVIRYRTS